MAVSVANLCFFRAWNDLLVSKFHYFLTAAPDWRDAAAIVLNVMTLAVVLLIFAALVRGSSNQSLHLTARLTFVGLLAIPLNGARSQFRWLGGEAVRKVIAPRVLMLLALVLVVAVIVLIARRFETLYAIARMAAIALAPFTLMTFMQAAFLVSPRAVTASKSRGLAPPGDKAKFVIMIFDELDQSVTFDRRPVDLSLPEIDRLAAQSVLAANAFPPADHTVVSIPAITTGRLLSAIEMRSPSELMIRSEDNRWLRWSEEQTIFDDAVKRGQKTAIAGWFHPYCRVLTRAVCDCDWVPAIPPAPPTIIGRMIRQQGRVVATLPFAPSIQARLKVTNNSDERRNVRIHEFAQVRRSALHFLQGDATFVFIHWPIPHEPAIFDRRSRTMASTGPTSYIDNVALVDRTIGDVRRVLERSGSWDSATIIVTADHGWRSPRARDFRVPLLIKLPRQRSALQLAATLNTVQLRSLLGALSQKQVQKPEDVVRWFERQPSYGRSPYSGVSDSELMH